jgi:hypothetical protein
MKNIYTLLIAILIATASFASDITISFANNNYDVVVDGRRVSNYNSNYNNTYRLNNLSYGRHRVDIYRSNERDRSNNSWNKGSNNDRPVYSSNLNLRPGYDLYLWVNKRGRVKVEERRNTNNYDRQNGYGEGRDRDHDGDRDRDHDQDHNGGYNRNGGVYGGNNGAYGSQGNNYNRAMPDADFNHLVQKIRGQWLGKLSSAKNAVQSNYFTTYQVGQLIQIFSSESDRLELAKLAYRNTVDQQNYRQLYNQFSYQSQNDLDQYIRTIR